MRTSVTPQLIDAIQRELEWRGEHGERKSQHEIAFQMNISHGLVSRIALGRYRTAEGRAAAPGRRDIFDKLASSSYVQGNLQRRVTKSDVKAEQNDGAEEALLARDEEAEAFQAEKDKNSA